MASKDDMKAAEATYSGFLGWLKWGTVASAIVAAIAVLLVAG